MTESGLNDMTEGGRLAGRVAVLTAAGSGIGRATALRLAAEGARLVVNDIAPERAEETADLVTAAGGEATALPGDVTDSALVDALVATAVSTYGALDVLHSNAGYAMAQGSILDITDEGWQADMQLNLAATFYCIRAAARRMSAGGGGAIVCTSSGSAVGAVPGIAGYGSTKAAILQLVRYAAMEFGPANIRVNAVIPGAVKTPAFMGYIGSEERLLRYEEQIPLMRACRPEDIANAVLFLASDEAACVTGTSVLVDGGVTAVRAEPQVG
jgi:NAD(P)-dependent dehydrogenase (short-subunit alcohol dehydrogenase family)